MAQTVYITGASAGLGRAIAQLCSAHNMSVGLIARDHQALQATALALPAKNAWAVADVASPVELENAFNKLESEIGPPDILINNAMATIFSRFDDVTPEEFLRATEVTFLGSVYGIQLALKSMKARGKGHIIQIGSALAYRAIPLQGPYCASKHAIRGATDALRCELIHDNIAVELTTVHMPAINTPQFDWARRHIRQCPQPVPPIYAPEACARAVLWAIEHPQMREVWVGAPTLPAIIGQRFMPAFMDRYMAKNAYEGQFEKASDEDYLEGNLFKPVTGLHRMHGRFESRERKKVFWVGISELRERLFYGVLALFVIALIAS